MATPRLFAATVALGVLFCTAARADEGRTGFELGLRTGHGTKLEDALGNPRQDFKGKIPVTLDVGYRVTPRLYVGLLYEYAFIRLDNDDRSLCALAGSSSCSAQANRLGLNVQFAVPTAGSWSPWWGLGAGLQGEKRLRYNIDGPSQGGNYETRYSNGLELLNLQGGVDFLAASSHLRLGPFVSLEMTFPVETLDLRLWTTLGVRGAFTLLAPGGERQPLDHRHHRLAHPHPRLRLLSEEKPGRFSAPASSREIARSAPRRGALP